MEVIQTWWFPGGSERSCADGIGHRLTLECRSVYDIAAGIVVDALDHACHQGGL